MNFVDILIFWKQFCFIFSKKRDFIPPNFAPNGHVAHVSPSQQTLSLCQQIRHWRSALVPPDICSQVCISNRNLFPTIINRRKRWFQTAIPISILRNIKYAECEVKNRNVLSVWVCGCVVQECKRAKLSFSIRVASCKGRQIVFEMLAGLHLPLIHLEPIESFNFRSCILLLLKIPQLSRESVPYDVAVFDQPFL